MLSEHPKIEYFVDGKPVGEPTLCPFTNEQMLMRCVQTIQTQCIDQASSTNKASQQSKQDAITNQGSKLVMVGTHQDLEGQCSESTREKNVYFKASFVQNLTKVWFFVAKELSSPSMQKTQALKIKKLPVR